MKNLTIVLLLVFVALLSVSCRKNFLNEYPDSSDEISVSRQVAANFNPALQAHPRLLMTDADIVLVKSKLNNTNSNKYVIKVHNDVINAAGSMLTQPVITYGYENGNMLWKARACVKRIFFLSYAYRMTGEIGFAAKAKEQLLATARYQEWDPGHFLDAAEMTFACSIGYDWLYNYLTFAEKAEVRDAIIAKGLNPSNDSNYNGQFLDATTNWNQVCHGSIAIGAIAVYEDNTTLCDQIINRAIDKLKRVMDTYGPDGCASEGIGYWEYGTTYNVMFIDAYRKLSTNNWDPPINTNWQTFRASANFLTHAIGTATTPSKVFNYSDNWSGLTVQEAMFWFARQDGLSLLYGQQRYFKENGEDTFYINDRSKYLLPLIPIWMKQVDFGDDPLPIPSTTIFTSANSVTPVSMMRSSWNSTSDQTRMYIGFKGGRSSVNHGHMDVGSFVLDAMDERWIYDLDQENYDAMKMQLGLGTDPGNLYWDRRQDALYLWRVFSISNQGHSTLTVNNGQQNVTGYVSIQKSSANNTPNSRLLHYAIADLTPAYSNLSNPSYNLTSALRGVAIGKAVNGSGYYGIVRDDVVPKIANTNLKLSFIVNAPTANVVKDPVDNKKVTVTINGKQLRIICSTSATVTTNIMPACLTGQPWPKNSGYNWVGDRDQAKTLLTFDLTLVDLNTTYRYNTLFIPSTTFLTADDWNVPSLLQW